jgi:hypothetical protein
MSTPNLWSVLQIETKQLLVDHPGYVDGLYNLGAICANQNQFDLAQRFGIQ